jgi:hypothetical protein
MVLNHTRVPWPRFIDGTCLPLKQLGFEGSLIQSKGVIFRRSMLNIVVVVVHARVEWHTQDAHASKNRIYEIELQQSLAGEDQRNPAISNPFQKLLHARINTGDYR